MQISGVAVVHCSVPWKPKVKPLVKSTAWHRIISMCFSVFFLLNWNSWGILVYLLSFSSSNEGISVYSLIYFCVVLNTAYCTCPDYFSLIIWKYWNDLQNLNHFFFFLWKKSELAIYSNWATGLLTWLNNSKLKIF